MPKDVRFPHKIMEGITRLARTRAQNEWDAHSKNPRKSPMEMPMSKDQQEDPYDDADQDSQHAELMTALVDLCDKDNEDY